MKVLVFLNSLSLGGTEKAARLWAAGLKSRGHAVSAMTSETSALQERWEADGIPVRVVPSDAAAISAALDAADPDVIHAHVPGYPHAGDVLGTALLGRRRRIPVVQTNIFGRLDNAPENAWTDFRLFVSWTSCVQAARRSFRKLDKNFFRRASVASNPLAPMEPSDPLRLREFRRALGVSDHEILLGRLSRPEPNKWTPLVVDAFRRALSRAPNIRLLLREPPPEVAAQLRKSSDSSRFIILPATDDDAELHLTMSALDVVLHTSLIGESFGYGIAEPMNLGKPVISHSVPWGDQAQIELVRHGECGFITSIPATMANAIVRVAQDRTLRQELGRQARQHIRLLADPQASTRRLESLLHAAVNQGENPFAMQDVVQADRAAAYLDQHQFGHSFLEQIALRPFHYRVRLSQWRRKFLA